jgi:hypothetical protein
MIGGSIVLAFVYFAIVYLAAFMITKVKPLEKPIVKKGLLLSVIKTAGIFVSLGGFLFGYSYWGELDQPLGVVGGVLICLTGISIGVIGKLSEDFQKVDGRK